MPRQQQHMQIIIFSIHQSSSCFCAGDGLSTDLIIISTVHGTGILNSE
jgi:hypothetical protein